MIPRYLLVDLSKVILNVNSLTVLCLHSQVLVPVRRRQDVQQLFTEDL